MGAVEGSPHRPLLPVLLAGVLLLWVDLALRQRLYGVLRAALRVTCVSAQPEVPTIILECKEKETLSILI